MIPPSLTLIVYGVTINESITKLFMAGVFPGLVLAGLFMLYIVAWHFIYKDQRPEPEPRMSLGAMLSESRFLLPLFGLVFVVIGSMYMGVCDRDRGRCRRRHRRASSVRDARIAQLGYVQEQPDGRDEDLGDDCFHPDGGRVPVLVYGLHRPAARAGEMIDSYNLSPIALIAVLTVFYLILGMFMDGAVLGCSDHGDCRADDPRSRN